MGNRQRKLAHGITPEAYADLLIESGGHCQLCERQSAPGLNGDLVIDHNHATKEVRGLVCRRCNTLLGYVEQAVYGTNWLRRAEAYLKR